MKCARTACDAEAHTELVHRETGRHYCARCARNINEGAGYDIIPFVVPDIPVPGTFEGKPVTWATWRRIK